MSLGMLLLCRDAMPGSLLPWRRLQSGLLGGDATRIHVNPDCGLKTRK